MKLIAVLGVLFVLASCSDSDIDTNTDKKFTYYCGLEKANSFSFGTFNFDLDNHSVDVHWVFSAVANEFSIFEITESSNDSITFQGWDTSLAIFIDQTDTIDMVGYEGIQHLRWYEKHFFTFHLDLNKLLLTIEATYPNNKQSDPQKFISFSYNQCYDEPLHQTYLDSLWNYYESKNGQG